MVSHNYTRPVIIAGPCVIESLDCLLSVAEEIKRLSDLFSLDIVFKASFDKANRTSIHSFRGPGLDLGLKYLSEVKARFNLSILTDIHECYQVAPVSSVADVIQIPAYLCRQTDLLVAAAKTGKTVNVKKGQFLSGNDMRSVVEKVQDSGNLKVWVTERGTTFGYNNLVVDFRNIAVMKEFASEVIMDCTHSTQLPGAEGGHSGGENKYILPMALAAKAFGATGYFFEVHPDPKAAKCDGPNMLDLALLEHVIRTILSEYNLSIDG